MTKFRTALILLVLVILTGCGTSKTNCDAYVFTIIDTLYIPATHLNYDGECYEYHT